jgi:YgiT-type zinc finger domain-containing protein
MVNQKTCPSCESDRIRKVRRTITRTHRGESYKVPNLDFLVCLYCGEEIYGPEAVRKIQAHAPAIAPARAPAIVAPRTS